MLNYKLYTFQSLFTFIYVIAGSLDSYCEKLCKILHLPKLRGKTTWSKIFLPHLAEKFVCRL